LQTGLLLNPLRTEGRWMGCKSLSARRRNMTSATRPSGKTVAKRSQLLFGKLVFFSFGHRRVMRDPVNEVAKSRISDQKIGFKLVESDLAMTRASLNRKAETQRGRRKKTYNKRKKQPRTLGETVINRKEWGDCAAERR